MGAETAPPGGNESIHEHGFNQAIRSAIAAHPDATASLKIETGFWERVYHESGEITPGAADVLLRQFISGEENDYQLTLLHDTFAETGELLIDRYVSEREQSYQNIIMRTIFFKNSQEDALYKRWLRGRYSNSSYSEAKQRQDNATIFFRKLEPAEIDTIYQVIDDVNSQKELDPATVTKLSHPTKNDLVVEDKEPLNHRNQARPIVNIDTRYL